MAELIKLDRNSLQCRAPEHNARRVTLITEIGSSLSQHQNHLPDDLEGTVSLLSDCGCRASSGVMLSALLTGALLMSCPARGETITAREMLRGTDTTAEACAQVRTAVWVTVYGQGFCMRYYLSTAGGEGDVPVVFLSGDRPTFDTLHENVRHGKVRSRARRNKSQARKAEDIDTDDLAEKTDKLSRQTGVTSIRLARMGLDGSSGHHGLRRTMLELHVTNAALDAIKQRHRFKGFHIFGQSGGSTLVGGLLALRDDIGCAIPGSGRLALIVEPKHVKTPALKRFDPVKMIPAILRNSSATRIIVLTDPEDKVVPRKNQSTFVKKFREAGGRIEQFYVESTNKKHHSLTSYSRFVMGKCIRDESHQDIRRKLKRFVENRLEKADEE